MALSKLLQRLQAAGLLIEFTPENVANMKADPLFRLGLYRELSNPFFATRRISGTDFAYYLISPSIHINGAAANGIPLSHRIRLKGFDSLDEARAEAIKRHKTYSAMAIRKKRLGKNYYNMQTGAEVPADALFAKPEEKENPSYEPLMAVLMDAYSQAANGKGAERHGGGRDFLDQDLLTITDVTGINGPFYQAIKKLIEGRSLPPTRARAEFLGAIIYIAGAIAWLDKKGEG